MFNINENSSNELNNNERSQKKIMILFLKIIFKIRIKNLASIIFLIFGFGWPIILILLEKVIPQTIIPYNFPLMKNYTNSDFRISYMVTTFKENIAITPKNNFTEFLANNFLEKPFGKKVLFYSNNKELEDFLSNLPRRGDPFLGINLLDTNEPFNFSKIFFRYVARNPRNSYILHDSIYESILNYTNKNVNISFEIGNYINPKISFSSRNGLFSSILINLSISCLLLKSLMTIIEFRELKILLLLTISGARESILWFSFIIFDLILILLQNLEVSIILYFSYVTYSTSFLLVFVYSFIFTLGVYFFMMTFVSFIYNSSFFKYISIFFIMSSLIAPMIQNSNIDDFSIKTDLKILNLFLPICSPFYFYQNIHYSIYLNINHSFENLNLGVFLETSSLLIYGFYTILFYFIIFLLFTLMNPRPVGAPPIGWKNFFNSIYWKSLFMKSSNKVESENLENSMIKVEKINKTYYGHQITHALKDVSFNILQREVIVLIGPNGCGKSTLLNSMTGTINSDSGNLYINNKLSELGFAEMQNYIGICFQENVYFPTLSVMDHLLFFGRIRGASEELIQHQIESISSSLDLTHSLNSLADSLSGGQKRKLCISIAFIGSPPIVILDEPTAGIDVSSRQIIWKSISQFKNTTSLISTHSLEEAESVSSRIFVMKSGEIVFMGTSSELRRQFNCGYRIAALGLNPKINELLEFSKSILPESSNDPDRPDSILVPVDDKFLLLLREILSSLNKFNLDSINVTSEGLEHVLLRLINEDE